MKLSKSPTQWLVEAEHCECQARLCIQGEQLIFLNQVIIVKVSRDMLDRVSESWNKQRQASSDWIVNLFSVAEEIISQERQ